MDIDVMHRDLVALKKAFEEFAGKPLGTMAPDESAAVEALGKSIDDLKTAVAAMGETLNALADRVFAVETELSKPVDEPTPAPADPAAAPQT